MIVKQLKEILDQYDDYDIVVCMDEDGGWDNVQTVEKSGGSVNIIWGGGSPFTSE